MTGKKDSCAACSKIKNFIVSVWKFVQDILFFIFCLNLENIPRSKTGTWISKNKNFFLISLILISPFIYFYFGLKNITDFLRDSFILRVLIISILYLICRIYWSWIKSVWKFFKKDGIIRYFFLIIIPIAIIVVSYQYWFHIPMLSSNCKSITVNQLNGFYASLFTAIAVLIGIVGLSAWRTVKKLKEIEDKVAFLHKKKDLADWARQLFDSNEKNDISSDALKLT